MLQLPLRFPSSPPQHPEPHEQPIPSLASSRNPRRSYGAPAPTAPKNRPPTARKRNGQLRVVRFPRAHREGIVLALASARPGGQRHRLFRPRPGPALPRRHAPNHGTVNRCPTMAVRLTTGKTSKIRPYDGIAAPGSKNRQNRPVRQEPGRSGHNEKMPTDCVIASPVAESARLLMAPQPYDPSAVIRST